MKRMMITRALAASLLACPLALRAQARAPTNSIEVAASASAVSNGYGNWSSLYARGAWQADTKTTFFPEAAISREFHDNGALFGLGATRVFDDDWYAFASTSTSAGGFYLPRFRGVALLNRKLLPKRQLVLNAGGSFTQWKDAHSDVGLTVGAIYYFDAPVVLEGGTNRNISRPGSVASQSYFLALTEGRASSHYLVAHVSGGREAYATLAPGQAITDFASHTGSLTLRQWVAHDVGFVAGAEYYANPFYHRTGLTLGGFWNIE
jgi:YaiO family outer membrane protein